MCDLEKIHAWQMDNLENFYTIRNLILFYTIANFCFWITEISLVVVTTGIGFRETTTGSESCSGNSSVLEPPSTVSVDQASPSAVL